MPESAVASQPTELIHSELSVKLMPMNSDPLETVLTLKDTIPAMFLLKSYVTTELPWKVVPEPEELVKLAALLTVPLTL